MERRTILVVDDERLVRWSIVAELEERGYSVLEAESAAEARRQLERSPQLVVLDDGLPDGDGMDLLRELRAVAPEAPVVFVVSPGNEARGTEALSQGAFHFVRKPFEPREVGDAVDEARAHAGTPVEKDEGSTTPSRAAEMLVGESEPMRAVKHLLARIAVGPARALMVSGERGTGRHLAARVLHELSDRATGPFRYHSGGLPVEHLIECLERCREGTLVLDQLGTASPEVQRTLKAHLNEATGARVVVIGDPNLALQAAAGGLDADLVRELQAFRVEMPPLRHRREDIPRLAAHFAALLSPVVGADVEGLSESATKRLAQYEWPGNVRELRDRIERALVFADGAVLDAEHVGDLNGNGHAEMSFTLPAHGLDLKELERNLVVQALERTKGNRTRAAELLCMTRDQMRYRVAKFGLD